MTVKARYMVFIHFLTPTLRTWRGGSRKGRQMARWLDSGFIGNNNVCFQLLLLCLCVCEEKWVQSSIYIYTYIHTVENCSFLRHGFSVWITSCPFTKANLIQIRINGSVECCIARGWACKGPKWHFPNITGEPKQDIYSEPIALWVFDYKLYFSAVEDLSGSIHHMIDLIQSFLYRTHFRSKMSFWIVRACVHVHPWMLRDVAMGYKAGWMFIQDTYAGLIIV